MSFLEKQHVRCKSASRKYQKKYFISDLQQIRNERVIVDIVPCLMLLSKAACDAAAVSEEKQEGMTLKRLLFMKPLLRAKDKAAAIPTKEESYFFPGIKLIVKVRQGQRSSRKLNLQSPGRETWVCCNTGTFYLIFLYICKNKMVEWDTNDIRICQSDFMMVSW